MRWITVAILVILYERLEYLWVIWEDVPIFFNVPYVYDGGSIRLDALVYNASVKIQNIILPIILYLVTPFKKSSMVMIAAFTLGFIELFITWNEPIAKIPLPFNRYFPISTAVIRLASVFYFLHEVKNPYLRRIK